MRKTVNLGIVFAAVAALLACTAPNGGQDAPAVETSAENRNVVFISDLHMGIGKDPAGRWYPSEDFRWPDALDGFLTAISDEFGRGLDLVIVGDFLELWQPPASVKCEGANADFGCTVEEMLRISDTVIRAHAREFSLFKAFAARDDNCIYVIPGNHDSTLLIDRVWEPVASAMGAGSGCVERVESGVWLSANKKIMSEHGHQIGKDPNAYANWPGVSKKIGGKTYVRRPWGELFVQTIFNREEAAYPLIDNLSPSSAGVRYRMADRGFGGSVKDVARFLRFNLIETSFSQKVAILGEPDDDKPPQWDVALGRSLGHRLFLASLAPDDEFAIRLKSDSGEWEQLRVELDAMARNEQELSDDHVLAMCDKLAARGSTPSCRPATAGAAIEKLLKSRKRVVQPHVKKRWRKARATRIFVYGHTHKFEQEWDAEINSLVSVSVLNDGAFQRVIDDDQFRALAASKGLEPDEALSSIGLDELPACYTYVTVSWEDALPTTGLGAWHMEEGGSGEFVDVCDRRCAKVGSGCD